MSRVIELETKSVIGQFVNFVDYVCTFMEKIHRNQKTRTPYIE